MAFCSNCGAELKDNMKFCPRCGTRTEMGTGAAVSPAGAAGQPAGHPAGAGTGEQEPANPDPMELWRDMPLPAEPEPLPVPPRGKKGRALKTVLIVLAILIAAAGLAGGILYGKSVMDERKAQRLEEELLTKRQDMEDRIFAITGSEFPWEKWKAEILKYLETLSLTDEERQRMEELWSEADAVADDDFESPVALAQSIVSLEEEVNARLEAEAAQAAAEESRAAEKAAQEAKASADALLAELRALEIPYATEAERQQIAEYDAQIVKLIGDGDFEAIQPVAGEWRELAQTAGTRRTGLSVSIVQYDFSEYPTVRLYLDVRDPATGEVVKELSPNMFYVSEGDARRGVLNRTVRKAALLNENERLNIDLLADTSGSMQGMSLISAKEIMNAFVSGLQFGAGDQVKMTQFNSDIERNGYFTGDLAQLQATINGYSAGGLTKLYDAIIYGVQDVSGQEGARCVIAFTDGMDEGSYNTADDVVNLVSRYSVPVFIVRIGDSSYSGQDDSLRRIAEASGGSFKNLTQFSADMSEFYAQVYRKMKEYYVVEYDADSTAGVTQQTEISVYVQKDNLGGEASITATPGDEFLDYLLGSYLRAYIVDMNNHNYDRLTEYVDANVDPNDNYTIQWQMKKQVSGGFSRVTSDSVLDYQVTSVEVIDENTLHIKTNEDYDTIFEGDYADMKNRDAVMARDAAAFLQNRGYAAPSDTTYLKVWARVNQIPEYILKKGSDGRWRFSSYTGDLALGENRSVYGVEIISN